VTYQEIPGWFGFESLYDAAVARTPPHGVMVEVGCWLGRSLAYLGGRVRGSGKPVNLWGVDHGVGTDSETERLLHGPTLAACGGNTLGLLAANLRACGVADVAVPMGCSSLRAAALFPPKSVDFVFLDAAHDEESVRADLAAWWPTIKPGGVMAGHDYDPFWVGVRRAVDEFFRLSEWGARSSLVPNCWWVEKPLLT
jgi:hypothetical protein